MNLFYRYSHYFFRKQTRSTIIKILLLLCFISLNGCSTYGGKVAPIPLPSSVMDHVNINNVILVASAYLGDEKAEEAFGFDIRNAGLLPVRIVIDNRSSSKVKIKPRQTFLIDAKEQAWPLLTTKQAYTRVRESVGIGETFFAAARPSALIGAAGAVAGFALGILSGKDLGAFAVKGAALGASAGAIYGGVKRQQTLEGDIRKDLARHSLRNRGIRPGELAHGFLFFPGDNEVNSAKRLRLSIEIQGQPLVISLPLETIHYPETWPKKL